MKEVQGTRLQIDSSTLQQHYTLRAQIHTQRATNSHEQARQLRKLLGTPLTVDQVKSGYSNNNSRDAADEALEKARDHDRRAARFTMLAKYIVPDSFYVISDNEADSLELSTQFRRQIDF